MSLKKIYDKLKSYGLSDKQAQEIIEMVRAFSVAAMKRYFL